MRAVRIPWKAIGDRIAGLESNPTTDNSLLPKAPSPLSMSPIEALQVNKAMDAEYRWTPDWMQLERTLYTPVFIYCNVTKGGKYHAVIEDIIKTKGHDGLSLTPYVITRRRFEVLQTKDGSDSFPIAFPSDAPPLTAMSGELITGHFSGHVKGRLYFVKSNLIKELDRFKQHGILFDRVQIRVNVPYTIQWLDGVPGERGSYPTGTVMSSSAVQGYGAWMYVGRPEYWESTEFSQLERCGISSREGEEPFYLFKHWEHKYK